MACSLAFNGVETLNSKYYTSVTSRLSDMFGIMAECIENAFCAIGSIGHLISSSFRVAGKSAPKGAENLEDSMEQANSTLGFVRTFHALENLVTLKWLFKRESDGSLSGSSGKRELRHPVAIAASLSLIAGRFFSFVNRLHSMAVVNLGKAAKAMSQATTAIFTALVTFTLVDSIRNFMQSKPEDLTDARTYLVQGVSFAAKHPFECGIGMSASTPILGIVGAAVSLVGSIAILATQVYDANGFTVIQADS